MKVNLFSVPILAIQLEESLQDRFNDIIKKYYALKYNNISSPWACSMLSTFNDDDFPINNIIEETVLKHSREYLDIIAPQHDSAVCNLSKIWMNISKTGCFQETHDHLGNSDAFISGSYYGKVPENSGNIYFESPIVGSHLSASYCLGNSINDLAEVKTEQGLLLLFPSWLRHGVRLNKSKETRVSVSFNVGVTPK